MSIVFVYGTLRKNERYSEFLKDAECLRERCWVYGKLYDTGCGYPALTLTKSSRTYGELYRVNEETLQKINMLEGYEGPGKDNLYDRVEVDVHTDTGIHRAFVYVMDADHPMLKKPIEHGDWKSYRLLQEKEHFCD